MNRRDRLKHTIQQLKALIQITPTPDVGYDPLRKMIQSALKEAEYQLETLSVAEALLENEKNRQIIETTR